MRVGDTDGRTSSSDVLDELARSAHSAGHAVHEGQPLITVQPTQQSPRPLASAEGALGPSPHHR